MQATPKLVCLLEVLRSLEAANDYNTNDKLQH